MCTFMCTCGNMYTCQMCIIMCIKCYYTRVQVPVSVYQENVQILDLLKLKLHRHPGLLQYHL